MSMALSQVARKCILRGDYSPLTMVPASALLDVSDADAQICGYLDLVPFALGEEEHPPKFSEPVSESENITMTVENLGRVTFVQRLLGDQSSMKTLPALFKLIISTSGSDLHAFVKTLARLYGREFDTMIQRLETLGLCDQFEAHLRTACSSELHFADQAVDWIADAAGLSNQGLSSPNIKAPSIVTPLGYLSAHGGSLHLGDASAVVGVNCQLCGEHFLLRIAMFRNEQHISHAQAYRLPGLKYHFSLPGGGRILGQGQADCGTLCLGCSYM